MVNTRCAVYRCPSTTHRNRELRFHQFPRDERLQIWLRACKRPELERKGAEQLKYMHICSLHFEKRMYGKQLLKKSALPTLNLPTVTSRCVSTQTDNYNIPDDLQILTSQGVQTDIDMETISLFKLAQDIKMSEASKPKKPRKRTGISQDQFLELCDEFLPSALGALVKMQLMLPNSDA